MRPFQNGHLGFKKKVGRSIRGFLTISSEVFPFNFLNLHEQSVNFFVLLRRKYPLSQLSACLNDSKPFSGRNLASRCELNDSMRFVVVGIPL